MKICIYGAGAIGGYLGAGLALKGADVTLIARGSHLEAIQQNGLTLIKDDERYVANVRAFEKPCRRRAARLRFCDPEGPLGSSSCG